MKTQIHSFRIQHKNSKVGIFNHHNPMSDEKGEGLKLIWDYEYIDCRVDEILERFREIPPMGTEFDEYFPDELDNLTQYKCAFNSLEQLFSILPIHLIEFILEFNFQIVELAGSDLRTPHQTFFKEEEVKIKPVSIQKILNRLAKKEAKKDIGKSLNAKNYIVYEI